MRNTDDESLAQTRAFGTTEERVVLALESIADQLRSLVAVVLPVSQSEEKAASAGWETKVADEGAWENEGGSLGKRSSASLGIKHSLTDLFETGGYRYTKLADAIAEARRARMHPS